MHEPGAPPHRPQLGPADGACEDLASAPTANTLSVLAVFFELHSGQATFSSAALIARTSFSNFASHCWQVYS